MTAVMDCILCSVKMNNLVALQSHLESDNHQARYKEILKRKDEAEEDDIISNKD